MRVGCHIKGRVQGVGFRFWVQTTAQRLNLTGWVKNEPDGSVSAVFEGTAGNIEAMLGACRMGPVSAQVSEVQRLSMVDDEAGKFSSFDITG